LVEKQEGGGAGNKNNESIDKKQIRDGTLEEIAK